MHSSISNSEIGHSNAKLTRFTIALLSTALALLIVVEAINVLGFDRISKVERRESAQRKALLSVKDEQAHPPYHMAVLGNSLMLEGLDVEVLADQLKGDAEPVPYLVLATDYYDWYFALKRLFAEGMRPRYILLGLSPNQLMSNRTRGEYAAQYLFQTGDLFEVAQKTHMDATTASSFMLSHVSKYYGTRQITRGYILKELLPGVAELLHATLGVFRDPTVPSDAILTVGADRLKALNALCNANGAQFMLVVPPTYQLGAETIAQAGKDSGVQVFVPVKTGTFDSSYFQADGFHLNQRGAAIFSKQLAAELQDSLQTQPSQ
jgi:hypothetical protein